jgi:ribosomal-protein-alanine N-acetyltransferase
MSSVLSILDPDLEHSLSIRRWTKRRPGETEHPPSKVDDARKDRYWMDTKLHFPSLESDRLRLRQLTSDDVEFVFRHFSDPRVTEYLMDEPPLTELGQARAIIDFYADPESKPHNRWGIALKSDRRLIGTCGYHKWSKEHSRAEIGYDLSPDFWGRGIMAEALKVALRNGFEAMDLNRVDALVYVENVRSVKLLEKLGFRTEGTLRDYFFLNGEFFDHYLMSLLRREWLGAGL